MNILDFLKQYDKERMFPDFVLCVTERYNLILLPYVYGLPDAILLNKTESKENWKTLNSSGSSSSGKKIKNSLQGVSEFDFNKEKYLLNAKSYIDNDKCLLDISIHTEFGHASHLTYDEILNKIIDTDIVELIPSNKYLSSLYEFKMADYKFYFAISRDQFYSNYTKVHFFSIEKEFKIESLQEKCKVFNTYRDGGTMEIEFEDYEIYIPTGFNKDLIPTIKILNLDRQYDLISCDTYNEEVINYLQLNKKLR